MNCPDKYIAQRMCDEGVNDFLAALRLIPNWFVARKMIKNRYIALYAYDNIIYFNESSGYVWYFCNEMGILIIDLNNIYLDNNLHEDDPDANILIRVLALHIKFKKREVLKR